MKTVRVISTFVISLLLLAGAAAGAYVLFMTAPQVEPEESERRAKVVQVVDLQPRNEKITVTAYGPVIPAREVVIRPQVEGRIEAHHEALVPGGRLNEGERLLEIEATDYELALVEQKAALEEAKFEADVEKGRRVVAAREWEELKGELQNSSVNESLVLREPHQRRTQAMVAKAQNAIAKAELDLERTKIDVPFNSMVIEESVEEGQLVQNGADVCKLVGTDRFWVRATLPVNELKWVTFPENGKPGSAVEVFLDSGNGHPGQWHGEVVRLLSDLEPTGRMARVLVEVDDPLGLQDDGEHELPLLLGSYVRVEIEAGRLTGVLAIPRSALREGSRIWIVDDQDKLQIYKPEVLWTRRETVLVSNVLKPGDRLVVSNLKSALPGLNVMPQALDDSETATAQTGP